MTLPFSISIVFLSFLCSIVDVKLTSLYFSFLNSMMDAHLFQNLQTLSIVSMEK